MKCYLKNCNKKTTIDFFCCRKHRKLWQRVNYSMESIKKRRQLSIKELQSEILNLGKKAGNAEGIIKFPF